MKRFTRSGSWTGNVAISKAQNNVVINTTGDGKTGTSNTFNVNPTSASVRTATGTGIATFSPDAGLIENLIAVSESSFDDGGKPSLVFPHGFFSFTDSITGLIPGATVTITITLPSAMPVGTQYWKYGPTPDNSTNHWYQLSIGDDDGDNIITITITDGGPEDDDLTANGVIVDQGGPGYPAAPPPRSVGGFLEPVDVFAVLAPYLALAGLIGVTSIVFAVKKRRRIT